MYPSYLCLTNYLSPISNIHITSEEFMENFNHMIFFLFPSYTQDYCFCHVFKHLIYVSLIIWFMCHIFQQLIYLPYHCLSFHYSMDASCFSKCHLLIIRAIAFLVSIRSYGKVLIPKYNLQTSRIRVKQLFQNSFNCGPLLTIIFAVILHIFLLKAVNKPKVQ